MTLRERLDLSILLTGYVVLGASAYFAYAVEPARYMGGRIAVVGFGLVWLRLGVSTFKGLRTRRQRAEPARPGEPLTGPRWIVAGLAVGAAAGFGAYVGLGWSLLVSVPAGAVLAVLVAINGPAMPLRR